MELEQAIRGRRSIRRYTNQSVPFDLIRKVIEAGTWAPSGKNAQQWRFTVLTGSSKDDFTRIMRTELDEMSKRFGIAVMGSSFRTCQIMEQAPAVILVWNAGGAVPGDRVREAVKMIEKRDSRARELGHKVEIQSVSAAIQNVLLTAHSLGLGTLWVNDIYYAIDALEKHMKKPWELVAAVTIGWPTEEEKKKSPPKKKSVDEVSEFCT